MPTRPPKKSNIQRLKQGLALGKTALEWGLIPFKWLFNKLQHTFNRAEHWIHRLPPSIQWLTVLVLLIWIAILIAFFIPGQYPFEGNLRATAISFAYTGQESRLFLNTLENLNKIDLQGSQPQPLTLIGQFSSSNPALNSKLSKLNKISIQLPNATSRVILTPTNPKTQQSELAIPELRINPTSQINDLNYQPQPAQLSFCLQSNSTPQACLNPESIKPTPQSIGSLSLRLGQAKIHVTLGQFKSPQLGSLDELSFDLLPATDDLQLELRSPTQLFIDLPNPTQNKTGEITQLSDLIWGDLDVSNVKFFEYKNNLTNVTDQQQISTILEGKVRIVSQIIDLQADQFLIIPPHEQGISKIRYIRLNLKPPYGLSISFAGKSKSIAVGLYPEFPVQDIKPSWLSKFPQEAINSFLSFLAALTAALLPQWLQKSSEQSKQR